MLQTLCVLCFAAALSAQSPPPRFEVATIRPSDPDELGGASGCETGRGLTRCSNVTLKRAIIGAYHIVPDYVLGGPVWIDSDRFQITGKASQPVSGDALILEIAKNGHKLQAASGGTGSYDNGPGRMDDRFITMAAFAEILSPNTRLPVVDRTGLSGAFTFTLTWNPDPPPGLDPNDAAAFLREVLSSAMQQQLGLTLKPQRMPVEMLVIDHAEKPSDN